MNDIIQPDIKAEIQLLGTEEGGLTNPMFLEKVGCILTFENENYSCFLLLPKDANIIPGDEVVLPIKFLYPNLIKARLKVGDEFSLRDFRIFANGRVTDIF